MGEGSKGGRTGLISGMAEEVPTKSCDDQQRTNSAAAAGATPKHPEDNEPVNVALAALARLLARQAASEVVASARMMAKTGEAPEDTRPGDE